MSFKKTYIFERIVCKISTILCPGASEVDFNTDIPELSRVNCTKICITSLTVPLWPGKSVPGSQSVQDARAVHKQAIPGRNWAGIGLWCTGTGPELNRCCQHGLDSGPGAYTDICKLSWVMMTSWHRNAFRIICPFVRVDSPHTWPIMWNFDAFPAVNLNKLLNKRSGWFGNLRRDDAHVWWLIQMWWR